MFDKQSKTLQYYKNCFSSMNCNKQRGQVAPHKAMMLMAVMDEVANGYITNGYIPHNERMVKAFERAWTKFIGSSSVFKAVFQTPFYHMANEPFWKLMRSDAYIELKEYSLKRLRESFYGAKIDDELFALMELPTSRQVLKKTLLETFIPNCHDNSNNIYMAAEPQMDEVNDSAVNIIDMIAA